MGYIEPGIPRDLVLGLIQARATPNFVETGTYMGGTTAWASRHFKSTYTIEVNPELSQAAAGRKDYVGKVEFLIGDSSIILPELVSRLQGTALFWLDGHYSGPGTASAEHECPVMAELAAISSVPEPIILIDDARCFFGPPPRPHKADHWINIDRIFEFFSRGFPQHSTTIHDDVIISVPFGLKPVVDRRWSEGYARRFPMRRIPLIERIGRRIGKGITPDPKP